MRSHFVMVSLTSFLQSALRERTSLAFSVNGRGRAREDWKEHAGILAAVIDGDEELAALLASRHVQNAAAAFARAQDEADQTADKRAQQKTGRPRSRTSRYRGPV
jgi:DNA-binding GntR family transcriptional regulator